MKKQILKGLLLFGILVLGVFLLSGCGNKDVKLDLEKIKTELSQATQDGFSIADVETNVNLLETDEILGLEYVYDFDLEQYGISSENIEDFRFFLNKDNKNFYAVIKPIEGKSDAVKTEMDGFIETMKKDQDSNVVTKYENVLKDEFEGYLIYIATPTQNQAILEKIKSSKTPLFSMMQDVNNETIESTLGIKPEQVDEFLMQTPMLIVKSSTYIIVKPAKGQEENVKNAVNEYMNKLEQQWSTYLPEQYEIVKNRLETQIGDYLIYIATEDNDKVLEIINNNQIKE